ncbi:Serine/threonine protein kinase [Giardia duodenalis]|uniref:Serine/threonine protein kinase n=1 Tax=Giardia intestinalis TaxID=5741 RepID=V6U2L2_GIAIN|nr:Serine/threonine protein kinase [Giardia intestinalis]
MHSIEVSMMSVAEAYSHTVEAQQTQEQRFVIYIPS